MCFRSWRRKWAALLAAGALALGGCASQTNTPGSGISSLNAQPPGGFGPVGRGGPTPPGAPLGPPGPVNLAGYNQLAEYQAADFAQKLAELQDENRSLAARLQGMQGLVEERERAALAARGEVQSATQEVTRARQEINRCRQEIASLRERSRVSDKENQTNLQALVGALESMLERDNPKANAASKEKDSKK